MYNRYKISDLAKDFNISSNKLLEILNTHIGNYKNDYCILSENEIAMVFDILTKLYSVKSFDNYFMIGYKERIIADKIRKDQSNKLLDQMAVLEELKAACAQQDSAHKKRYDFNFQSEKSPEYLSDIVEQQNDNNQKPIYFNKPGEKDVEYVIKWFIATQKDTVISIEHDCESKYSSNCILLNNPELLNDPQEYDHVLVTKCGIIIIETKHWEGNIQIRHDQKWIKEKDGNKIGLKSPDFQMKRHETLIKSIFPNTPIHSILCFSNPTVIIDGTENITDYPVITIEQLNAALSDLCTNTVFDDNEIKNIAEKINSYKVNMICANL